MRLVRSSTLHLILGLSILLGVGGCGPDSPIQPPQTSPDTGEPPDGSPPPPPPIAAGTERVAVHSDGTLADGDTAGIDVNFDGSVVAFASSATNLVDGDTNDAWDVFVRDRTGGVTERVSVGPGGTPGDGDSRNPSIDADGRLIAFESLATNLAGGHPEHDDVFVHDRATGTTELISVAADGGAGNGPSYAPTISSDGRYVVFHSEATNLVPDRNAGGAFVRDRQTGTTTHIPIDAPLVVSGDARTVAYLSDASTVVLRDLESGHEHPVAVTTDGAPPNADLMLTGINEDGSVLGFHSLAGNLDPAADDGWGWNVFVHDRSVGATELVSVTPEGTPGDNFSFEARPNADGRFVLFTSLASDLLPEHDHVGWSLYVRDRELERTHRVPVSTGPTSLYEFGFTISGDGRHVVFTYIAEFDNEGYQAGVEGLDAHPAGVTEVFVHSLPAP